MRPANALAYFAQLAVIVAACAGLPRLVGLRSPTVQHLFWRLVLAVCLVLPVIQPRQPDELIFVPAPVTAPSPAAAAAPLRAAPSAPGVDWIRLATIVIAAGIAVRLAWIAAGLVRLQRLRRSGVEPATGFDDVRQAIGVADVSILWSSAAPHPVTFGARRPVVLLPVAIKSVDAAAQRAVVAHELHHVKRHDWLWTIAEEIVRAAFWFHPAMWWLISRVQLARETVVDELTILTTNARRAYLDTLLALADDAGLHSTTAFSARRHLFHRVMLLSKEGTMSSTRIAISSCALAVALAAGTWTAVGAFPLRGGAPESQAELPQTPASYHAVAHHYWEVIQNDTTLIPEEKLGMIARAIAAEDRALAVDPNFIPALVYKNIFLRLQANLTADPSQRERLIVEADALRQTVIVLQESGRGNGARAAAPDGAMPPPPPPPPPPPGSIDFSAMPPQFARLVKEYDPLPIGTTPPMKVHDVKPVYPPIASAARVQGVVALEVLIDASGSVVDAHVIRSIPLLDEAARSAVMQWKYRPLPLNGQTHAVLAVVTVNFTVQP